MWARMGWVRPAGHSHANSRPCDRSSGAPPAARRSPHSLSRASKPSPRGRRFRKIHDAIEPVPSMTLIPELCQQSRLVTVVGAADGTAEEHQSAVVMTGTEHLPRMPGKRRPVERDQHQSCLSARRQQCSVIETKPRPVPPVGNVDNRKRAAQAPAGRDEPMRRVLVSQQPLCQFLRRATCGFPRGRLWHRRAPASRARGANGSN